MEQPKVGEKIYSVCLSFSNVGETEFLCSTQENATKSLKKALKEAKDIYEEHMENYDPPLTLTQAKEELGEVMVFEMKRIY